MAVFATHVVLMRDFQAVSFAPGDELPEWAEGLVGAHCLEPEDGTDADTEDADEDQDPETESEEKSADDEEPSAAPTDAPDFTAPAPVRRRGRTQK